MNETFNDISYMRKALRLAVKAKGRTSPNPMVGAVVVRNGEVVGQGYHRRAGSPHAEVLALEKAGKHARGATLYVTLEPCCHTSKRTPPCVPGIRAAGIERVVVAMLDPNPKVRGKGIRQLRHAGMAVDVGCLEGEAKELNHVYRHWVTTGRPFVIVKAAMTLDGKIATAAGESKWITGEHARQHVHQLRSQVDAIMVGLGTVVKDNPELSGRSGLSLQRHSQARQPVRVVVDSRLRMSAQSKVLRWPLEQSTIICTTSLAPKEKIARLRTTQVNVLVLPQKKGKVSLAACFSKLGALGITSVVVEGGSELNAALFNGGWVNQVQLYVAPRLLGGADALGVIGGSSPKQLSQAFPVTDLKIQKIGEDFIWIGNCLPNDC